MKKTIVSLARLEQQLEELFSLDAYEMVLNRSKSVLYIPYMMNDALEDYFILENVQVIGTFSNKLTCDTSFEIHMAGSKEEKHALVFQQPDQEALVIFFTQCLEVQEFYQFHRIGHFWVKGQEHWRRLVYIAGTLYAKGKFLGLDSCNEHEEDLLLLMEFAPFRHWSPVHESLDGDYPDTQVGIEYMKKAALAAGDKSYYRLVSLYAKFPLWFIEKALIKKMLSPRREKLYQYLNKKAELASLAYQTRRYGENLEQEMEKARTQFTEKLLSDGYSGAYPNFQKGSAALIAMEEHIFTIEDLEYENFCFSITGMVTDAGKHYLYQ